MELNTRLFVGGLAHNTTDNSLMEHFGQYGDVEKVDIIKDRDTGCSRGFGFVTFSDSSSTDKALADDKHCIMGKKVDVKIATPKISKIREAGSDSEDSCSVNPKRIFVGGLPQDVTEEEFREYFGRFGEIIGVEFPRNHGDVNKLRGFGYATFGTEQMVDDVLSVALHMIREKPVEVRRATYPRKVEAAHRRLTHDSCSLGLCSHGGVFVDYPCWCSFHCNGGMVAPMPYCVWWNGSWCSYYPDVSFGYQDNSSFNKYEYSDSSFNSDSILDMDSYGWGSSQESLPVKRLAVGEMRSCEGLSSIGALRIDDKDKSSNRFNCVKNDTDKEKCVNTNGYDGTSTNQEILNIQFPKCIESALLVDEVVGLKEKGYEDQNGTCKNDQDGFRVGKVGLEDPTGEDQTGDQDGFRVGKVGLEDPTGEDQTGL